MEMVTSVPNSILNCVCKYSPKKEPLSVTIIGIGEDRICLRMPSGLLELEADKGTSQRQWEQDKSVGEDFRIELTVCSFEYRKQKYEKLHLTALEVVERRKREYWDEITLLILDKQEEWKRLFHFFAVQYMEYIRDKMDSYGNEYSQKMCGYPAELDSIFTKSLDEITDQIGEKIDLEELKKYANAELLELAGTLCQWGQYKAWIDKTRALEDMKDQINAPDNHAKIFYWERIYFGNAYCWEQCPSLEMWQEIFFLLQRTGQKCTMVFPPISEAQMETLDTVFAWLQEQKLLPLEGIELVINDWGTLQETQILRKKGVVILAGTMLCKARRDPRSQYRIGLSEMLEAYGEQQSDAMSVQKILNANGVKQLELTGQNSLFLAREPLEYGEKEWKRAWHFPFYQTNTSSFCTLKALMETGNRGIQKPVSGCPKYCEQIFCAYPSHLNMVGIGNSLFGYSLDFFCDQKRFRAWKERGIHRIVWNGAWL